MRKRGLTSPNIFLIVTAVIVLSTAGYFFYFSGTAQLSPQPFQETKVSTGYVSECKGRLSYEECDSCPCSASDPGPCGKGCRSLGITEIWNCHARRDCSGSSDQCYDMTISGSSTESCTASILTPDMCNEGCISGDISVSCSHMKRQNCAPKVSPTVSEIPSVL